MGPRGTGDGLELSAEDKMQSQWLSNWRGKQYTLILLLVLPEHLFTVDVYAETNRIRDEGCWWLAQQKGRGEQSFNSGQGGGNAMLSQVPLPKLEGSRLRVLNLRK